MNRSIHGLFVSIILEFSHEVEGQGAAGGILPTGGINGCESFHAHIGMWATLSLERVSQKATAAAMQGHIAIFDGCKPSKMGNREIALFRFRVVKAQGRAFATPSLGKREQEPQAAMTHNLVFDSKDGEEYWYTANIGWVTSHSYIVYGPLYNGATRLVYEGVPTYPTPAVSGRSPTNTLSLVTTPPHRYPRHHGCGPAQDPRRQNHAPYSEQNRRQRAEQPGRHINPGRPFCGGGSHRKPAEPVVSTTARRTHKLPLPSPCYKKSSYGLLQQSPRTWQLHIPLPLV